MYIILLLLLVNYVLLIYMPPPPNENYASLLDSIRGHRCETMQRRKSKKSDNAVSPVVGVMLMLVVTIIIAAIVATMAGGLITTQKATPSAAFDVELTTNSLEITALSLSDEIPSKDIKIVLSKPGATRTLVAGGDNYTVPFGFNIVETGAKGFKDQESVSDALADPSISQTYAANLSNSVQWFGNYTLKSGSRMSASSNAFNFINEGLMPDGFTQSSFTKSDIGGWTESQWTSVFGDTVTTTDLGTDSNVLKLNSGMTISDASLVTYLEGKGFINAGESTLNARIWAEAADTNWSFGQTCVYGDGLGSIDLEAGDSVTVMIVYLPSGQTLFTKTVTVGA